MHANEPSAWQEPCSAEAVCWNTGVWELGFGRMVQEVIPEPTPVVHLTQMKL